MTLDEQIVSVEREIRLRARVYPRLIAAEKLSQAKADHETAAMKAVLETLRAVKDKNATYLDALSAPAKGTKCCAGTLTKTNSVQRSKRGPALAGRTTIPRPC